VTAETSLWLYHPDQRDQAADLHHVLTGANLDATIRTVGTQTWQQIREYLTAARARVDIVDMRPTAAWRHPPPQTGPAT
jgi:hypothetical protein